MCTSEPLVSVIIPTFNRRSMVCEAIESAAAQDVVRTEVIVVDDGSTDGTAEVVRANFPHVRLISVERRSGRSAARNLGIEAASAPFVAFLDSDDRFRPSHLRQLTSDVDRATFPSDEVRYGTAGAGLRCGIAAYVSFHGAADRGVVQRQLATLVHGGANSVGEFGVAPGVIGQTRLAVIDVGNQKSANHGRVWSDR